jgi:hypothetical protein
MPRRMYFHVQCDRCRTYTDASSTNAANTPGLPVGWSERSVIPVWAMGAAQEAVALCRNCTEAVDARMGRAWHDAIETPPRQGKASDA